MARILALLLFWPSVALAQNLPTSHPATITAVSVGVTSAKALGAAAPAGRVLLAIDNESASATVACAFGATAALNTAGSFTIPPGVTRVWDDAFIPNDQINCIASAVATPVTIEAELTGP